MGILKILLVLLFLLPTWAWSATYYVKNGGNDALTGLSDAQAWETIAKVQATVTGGDTIYFRSQDTWEGATTQVLNATTAGVTYNGSTYGTGTRATLKAIGALTAVVRLSANNLSFSGFNVNMNSQITGGIYIGTYATSNISVITVDDCKVHDSSMPAGNYGYGIHVGGYAANDVVVDSVTIINTEVYNTGHEAFAIYPSWLRTGCKATNVTIRNCSGHHAGLDGESWGHALYITNAVENLTVEFSSFYNSAVGVGGGTSTVYCGSPTGIILRYNLIYNNTGGQMAFAPNDVTNGITGTFDIYGNIIYGNAGSGIYFGGDWNTSIVNIYNNIVYSTSTTGYPLYVYGISGTGTPFYLKNNILVADNYRVFKFNTVADEALFSHSNNLIYRVSGEDKWYIINDVNYTAANVKDTWDATAQNTNPTFTEGTLPTGFSGTYGTNMVPNTTYFAISSGNALNNGATLGSPYNGCINGAGKATPIIRPGGVAYDIGAYEWIGNITLGTGPALRIDTGPGFKVE